MWQPANTVNLKAGVRRYETKGTLPDELRAQVDAFGAGLVADQGGASEVTTIGGGYVRKLRHLEGYCELLAADLKKHGITTKRGSVRSAFTAYLAAIDRWDRIAQRLGMARRAKPVQDVDAYLDRFAQKKGHPS